MKRKFLQFVCLALIAFPLTAKGGELIVYRLSGKVVQYRNGKAQPLKLRETLNPETEISVEYESMVELLDSEKAQRYTIKVPGRGKVQSMAKQEGNSISALTRRYISYVQNQMSKNSQVVKAQSYTDFATVTRESATVKSQKKQTAREQYDAYRQSMRDSYEAYRRKMNKEYNDFVRQAWEEFQAQGPVARPLEKKVDPVIFNEEEQTDRLRVFGWIKKVVTNVTRPNKARRQPQPLVEIKEVKPSLEEAKYEPMPFTFYGTDMAVRLDESKRFNIGAISPNKVADLLDMLNTKNYDNAIYDCLKLREEYRLCDWAYINMLETMSEQFCGPGTNEAVLLTGYLLSQSGYKMRFAADEQHLYLLVGVDCLVYGRCSFEIDGISYYPLVEEIPDRLSICPAAQPKEQCMEPSMAPQPIFAVDRTPERGLVTKGSTPVSVKVSVNKNLIDFYNNYPAFETNRTSPTRWAYYANAPMDTMVCAQLYPQLKQAIEGKSEKEAVGVLLNWIQYAFPYEFDDVMWGGDRTFFTEETLFYKGCDCEDRSILLTRLVRDLVGLRCVLIYYPGHLAAAVHFNEEVKGDCFVLDNESYVVCDPTYIGADIGMQMPGMEVDAARVIAIQ